LIEQLVFLAIVLCALVLGRKVGGAAFLFTMLAEEANENRSAIIIAIEKSTNWEGEAPGESKNLNQFAADPQIRKSRAYRSSTRRVPV
jgi:hypothetical protein